MMKLPFSKKKKEIFLALDLGTETVKSLIFQKEKDKIIILGADLKEYYSFGIEDGRTLEKKEMGEAIWEVVNQAKKQAREEIKNCPIFWRLPGNILKERIISQSFQRKNPNKVIDSKEEQDIYQKISKASQEKIFQEILQEKGILSQDLHFLDVKILERKIDGYGVDQLSSCTGQNLDFQTSLVFLPKNYLNNIRRITRALGLNRLKLIPEGENLHSVFSGQKRNAFFLDIGGKLTQIVLIKESKLQAVDSFEMGGEVFSQKLSQSFGTTKAQAEDLKIKYAQRILSEEVRKRMRESLFISCQLWFNNLKLKLKDISKERKGIFPPTIFIFGGGSQLPEIEEILSQDIWEDLPFWERPQINFILSKDLKNLEDRSKKINTSQYIPILLLCYATI